MSTTEDTSAACRGSGSNDLLGAASEAHKLTDRQIEDLAFAVLREHNDDRLWRALTYDRGPYDVTTPSLALCHLARVFFGRGCCRTGGLRDMVQPPDIAVAEELCAKRGGYSARPALGAWHGPGHYLQGRHATASAPAEEGLTMFILKDEICTARKVL